MMVKEFNIWIRGNTLGSVLAAVDAARDQIEEEFSSGFEAEYDDEVNFMIRVGPEDDATDDGVLPRN